MALKALFKHSFYDDVWEYRRKVKGIPGGRWYAAPGEPGLIMCSFPRGGAAESVGKGGDAWATMYFNECMSGFEYQVAAHMISEDLIDEGLALVYAIHQRYHGAKRNPYNEIDGLFLLLAIVTLPNQLFNLFLKINSRNSIFFAALQVNTRLFEEKCVNS